MTPLPPNADELISAYLDGEAAPEEIALIEANPELMTRVDALRSVSQSLAASEPPNAERKEAHLAAALGVFDELMGAATAVDEPAPAVAAAPVEAAPATVQPTPAAGAPISLDAARERKRGRKFNGLLAAAAAVVLVFVGVTVFSLRDGGESFDTADSALDAASEVSDEAAGSSDGNSSMLQADRVDEDALSEPTLERSPAAAAPEDSFAGDDAMADEEEAMQAEEELGEAFDDAESDADADAEFEEPSADAGDAAQESADDEAADDASAPGAGSSEPTDEFFLGEFETLDALVALMQLEYDADQLAEKAASTPEGLFSSCQAEIASLAGIKRDSLVGQAIVGSESVELHLISETGLAVVDATRCAVTESFEIGGP